MENAPFESLNPAIFRQKPQKQNRRAHALHEEAPPQHHSLQPDNAVDIPHAEGLGHHQPLLQADAPAQKKDHHGSRRHEAQSAGLNEAQQHDLSKAAPLAPGIEQGQPRDAGSRGSREQSRKEPRRHPASGGRRQVQQQRPQQDDHREGRGNDLGGAQAFRPFLHPELIQFCTQRHGQIPFPQAYLAIILCTIIATFMAFASDISSNTECVTSA